MFAKSKLVWVAVLVAVLSLVGVASATAQTTPGSASSAAAGNETGLVMLNPGQQHWYSFHSAAADPQAGNREITVMLESQPQGSVTFDVWTPAGLQRAAEGNTDINARPVGSGSLHPVKDGDDTYDRYGGRLEWTGGSGRPQTYAIQVKPKASGPVQYNLTVNGNYVQVPDGTLAAQASKQGAPATGGNQQPQAAPTVAPTGATAAGGNQQPQTALAVAATGAMATPTPPASQPAGPVAGSSPDTALPLDGAAHPINPGQSQWYVLYYPGESRSGWIPIGTVVISALPWGSANFNIWSDDRLRALELGDTRTGVPVGSGMLHPVTREGVTTDRWDGKPAWTNRSNVPAKFYIQVQTTGNKPSTYTLGYTQQ